LIYVSKDKIQRTGGKNGTKRHILVDGRGVPVSIVVTGANRHDVTQLKAVLENIVVKRPEREQTLCADKGYQGKSALLIILSEHYIPHVKQLNEEVQEKKITRITSLADGLWRYFTHGSIGSERFW